MADVWVEKHTPQSTDEIQGQDKAVQQLKQELDDADSPILLHGPPGTGKTSALHAIANENGWEVIEVNASDVRNKKNIKDIVGGALKQQSLLATNKVILVDEVDGLAGNKDRGGVQAIKELTKEAAFPVVLTANDPYQDKIRSLRKQSEMIEFGHLDYRSVRARLRQIAEKEGIAYDEDALTALARRAGGDIRGAITDMQVIEPPITKEKLDVLGGREQQDSVFDALQRVFKTTSADTARGAFDQTDLDLDETFDWIENNIHREYTKSKDLSRAFDALSIADIYQSRIHNWQHYRFYVYIYDLLTAGIALAKDEKYSGYTRYKRSRKGWKIWQANRQNAKKESIATRLATVTHTSEDNAKHDALPYFRKAGESFTEKLADSLELDEDETEWLTA